MPQDDPDIRKILSRNGFNPDTPPSDIGLKNYYKRESLELHPDKIGNPNFVKYKNINEKSRLQKFQQLSIDYNILQGKGYSFGKSSFGKSSFGESSFINKTKTFLKNLGSGIWKHKSKILILSYIAGIALFTGRERGRIDKFSKALTPRERKEFEEFMKEMKEILDKYNKTKDRKQFEIDLYKIRNNKTVIGLIDEYYKLYYPVFYKKLQEIAKKESEKAREMEEELAKLRKMPGFNL
jgi:hypothetical protein